jgi:hypothetical protein
MMEAGRCIEVLNPYDWLPGYGENSVQIYTEGLDFCVLLGFDGEDGRPQEKRIRFKKAFAFYKGSFPGPSLQGISYSVEDKEKLAISGRIIEFPDSQAAQSWRDRPSGSPFTKHYKAVFLAENIVIEVFAESVALEDVQDRK